MYAFVFNLMTFDSLKSRYTSRMAFIPFKRSNVSTDVSAHCHLSDMAKTTSASICYLISLGQKLKNKIENDERPFDGYVAEVASLLPENAHE